MRSARGLALLCGFLKNDEWVLTLSWGSKRIDTKVSILLGLQFPLFLSLAKIGERRPLRNRGTAEDFFSATDELPSESVLLSNLFAVSDTVLLHMRFHLRRRDIPVSRNSFARYYGRHLRALSDDKCYTVGCDDLGAPCKPTAQT